MDVDVDATIPPALLVIAVERDIMPLSVAQAHARAMQRPFDRAMALVALVPHAAPDQQALAAQEALAAIPGIPYESYRAEAFARLAPHLPESSIPEALSIARLTTAGRDRVIALTALVPLLAAQEQSQVIQEAFIVAATPRASTADTLIGLIPHLPAPLLRETINNIRSDIYPYDHAKIAAALLPYLSPADRLAFLPEALAYARGVQSPYHHAIALTAVAPFLSDPDLQKALSDARSSVVVGDRFAALLGLAPHLPLDQRSTVLQESLTTSRDIVGEVDRASALLRLTPFLPADQQRETIREALYAARRIGVDEFTDQMHRSELLAKLAAHLPIEEQAPVLNEAMATARRVEYPTWRVCAFADLLPSLPLTRQADVVREVLAAIREIDEEEDRDGVLTEVASSFPTSLVQEMLTACYGFPGGATEFGPSAPGLRQP